jgi:hypothetical protein
LANANERGSGKPFVGPKPGSLKKIVGFRAGSRLYFEPKLGDFKQHGSSLELLRVLLDDERLRVLLVKTLPVFGPVCTLLRWADTWHA